MPYNHYIGKRQPKPKKSQTELKQERIGQLLDLVHASFTKELSLYNAQRILGWGDGIFERIVRDVKEGFTNEVQYVKKGRKFASLLKISPAVEEEQMNQEYHKESETKTVSEQNRTILID